MPAARTGDAVTIAGNGVFEPVPDVFAQEGRYGASTPDSPPSQSVTAAIPPGRTRNHPAERRIDGRCRACRAPARHRRV